jgi:hypothetical protein
MKKLFLIPVLLIGVIAKAQVSIEPTPDNAALRNTFFLQFTGGVNSIANNQKSPLDTVSRIDFTQQEILWSLQTGYYVTNWFAITGNFSFLRVSSSAFINTLAVDLIGGEISAGGLGSGGAAFQYGLGVRFVPYTFRRLRVYTNLSVGNLKAIVRFANLGVTRGRSLGSAVVNTSLVDNTADAFFFKAQWGIDYRLNTWLSTTSNVQYLVSSFDTPIGSVKGFTGFALNFGLCFTIKPE